MIRTLLTSTALAALLTTGALAQDTVTPVDPNAAVTDTIPARAPMVLSEGYAEVDGDNLVSRVVGSTVYTSAAADADAIGDINDLVVDGSGDLVAAVIGVGGFLGLGEKNVAVNFDELKWEADADGNMRYVLATTAEALTSAPDFVYDDESPADQAANVDNATPVANPDVVTDQPATDSTMAATPFDRSGLTDFDETTITAEELKGTRVFGVGDTEIGTIGDIVLDDAGAVDAVIVDVGGFLGLGKKPVAVGFNDLSFSTDADGNRYLFINTTKEQLEAQPAFDSATYTTDRDAQRIVVTP